MRLVWFICFILFLPIIVNAQSNVTGRLLRADTKSPVAKASVFLSNSSFGTASAEDGSFTLANVRPGQYTLVVTSVGFEDHIQTILVAKEPINLNITLMPKVMELRGVVISTHADWKKNYEMFKKDFIGVSKNSEQCKVINPHILDLIYNRTKQTLEASADEFLIVENHALGYRVKFLVKSFVSDKINYQISWQGQALFEELPGNETQKLKWKQKREEAYYGSAVHFYRSLYTNQLNKEGFVIRRLIRRLNPDRPRQEIIQQKMKRFYGVNRDSANYWIGKNNIPKYKEDLIRQPLAAEQICAKTDHDGLYAMGFPDCLYVVYTKRHEEFDFKDLYRPLDMENFETSVVTLLKNPYLVFDMNGTIVSQPAPLYEGTWSKARLAELLPVDYMPGN